MPQASARHILVESEVACTDLKERILRGESFADLARSHSTCPSSERGGELGAFEPGQMVREFDEIVFRERVGVVHGPVKTQFGFHLIEITSRRP